VVVSPRLNHDLAGIARHMPPTGPDEEPGPDSDIGPEIDLEVARLFSPEVYSPDAEAL
jgi:hypothetical protein